MNPIRNATRIQLALLALLAGLIAVPAAQASTVGTDPSGALLVSAGPERNDIGLQEHGVEDGRLVIYDGVPGNTMVSATGACEEAWEGAVVCTWNPAAGVRVDLGGGNDEGYVSAGLPANAVFAIAGGEGDDKLSSPTYTGQATTLEGGPGTDKLEGGSGPDTLRGGEGNDTLTGVGGSDRLYGEGGDDNLSGDGNKGASADLLDGGPGLDTIDSDWEDESSKSQTVRVTLDGVADDGRPGEGDNVANVESVTTYQGSVLVGGEAGEHLEAFQTLAASTLTGNGGNDELKGSGGPDKLDGGPGDDYIDAGFGDDTIVGGPGRDTIYGDLRGGDCGPLWCTLPYGNDTIEARDGAVDSVSCGPGEDRVTADPGDVVASDCETVLRGAVSGGAGGGKAKRCVVPKLAGLKAKTAKKRLKKAGCKARVRLEHSRKVRRGRVIGSSPKAKKKLPRGAKVTLVVSKG